MDVIISNMFFSILSVVLFFVAPDGYSYSFCLTIAILYTLQNILYFSFDKRESIISFEFFFAIAFGLTNFVYPIVYFPTNPEFSIFKVPFNHAVISKATALAYLAYNFFLLGLIKKIKMNREKPDKPNFRFNLTIYHIVFLIAAISFVLYLYFGGFKALQSVYSGGGDIRKVGRYSYFQNIFTIACYLAALFLFMIDKSKQLLYFFIIAFLGMLMLLTGSRVYTLGLGLILIVGYNNHIKRLRFLQILFLIVAGAILMFVVVIARRYDMTEMANITKALSSVKLNSIFDVFSDLVINNRNLYVLTEYGDTHPLRGLYGMLVDIFSPIPGITSRLVGWLDVPVELITGGALPTYLDIGENSAFGLGTNMVGEAYVAFGLIGVMVSFYLIGHIIKWAFYASRYNIYAYVLYYLLISHAVFYPRSPLLFNPRLIVWALLLVSLVYSITYWKGKEEKDISVLKNNI